MSNHFRKRLIGNAVYAGCWLAIVSMLPAEDADSPADGLGALASLLADVDDAALQLDLLNGMHQALEGRREVKMPDKWAAAYASLSKSADANVRERALQLALIFGDQQAVGQLRETMLDSSADDDARRRALVSLVQVKPVDLARLLQQLLENRALRGEALRGLATYDDSATPELIIAKYDSFSSAEKQDAVQTLAARPEYADALLDAVEQRQIPPSDISAFAARQLQDTGDDQFRERLARLWGDVRSTPEQAQARIEECKNKLTQQRLAEADLVAGRVLFLKHCQNCHTLYGEGGKIGPDITGGHRDNLDYVLENIFAPSAAVPRDYRVTTFRLDDGRVIAGIITGETNRTLAVQTVNERIVLDKNNIEQSRPSQLSMMPDGLADKLADDELRDLVAFLAVKRPIPLPPPESQEK